jgi:hypothetical protein
MCLLWDKKWMRLILVQMSYYQCRWQTTDLVDVLTCEGNVKYSNLFQLLQFVRQSRPLYSVPQGSKHYHGLQSISFREGSSEMLGPWIPD